MLKTLLDIVLGIGIAVARIAIMVAVAALTLAGRILAGAIGALWRRRQASRFDRTAPESITPSALPLAPEPRARASRPRPFKF